MRVLGYERRWGSTIKEWPSLSTVEVRLLRFWEARNVRRDGELMGVDMCLVLRLVAQDTKLTPVAPLLKSYAKAGDSVNPEETDSAPFVKDMEGGTYTFQVRVGSYNFTANHQTFTISRINSVDDRVPHPEFVDNGGDDGDGGDNQGQEVPQGISGCRSELDNFISRCF
ncbi:hypothetical protein Bca52824_089780 [Brassica carinata]|uniref:Uncharacterized protein n=1 Tax=Brassica carinata TaxID=52824 RepID=A0A8X7TEC2_BRACI|nr:hypothetical protein Bca52824_089780 [Brassica carinata]